MSAVDSKQAREQALRDWFETQSGQCLTAWQPVAGDASFRRYFRARLAPGLRAGAAALPSAASPGLARVVSESAFSESRGSASIVLCDSPPESEKNCEFIAIAEALANAGVRVPKVLAVDLARGFFALEDLGDQLLLPLLDATSVDGLYRAALAMLERLAGAQVSPAMPHYDYRRLADEMALFPEWFCKGLLGLEVDVAAAAAFRALEGALCARALSQPQVLVHRDFHSRNLMVLPNGELATIDFQDAVIGPLSYDPVSLLRDCYVAWPCERVHGWALAHRGRLSDCGIDVPAPDDFLIDIDWMGLQRHIKVLGIFARLYLRDGKRGYLADLPRVIAYVREVLGRYENVAELAGFASWFETAVMPRAQQQPWFQA